MAPTLLSGGHDASLDQNAAERLLQRYLPVSGQCRIPLFGLRRTREHTLSSDRSSPAIQDPKACSRSRASPVSRRAFGEPDAPIVGSPSPPFPAEEPELHDPPLRVGRMHMGEETRVKDCRTSRRFPSSLLLLGARVTEPPCREIWRSLSSRQTGLRPPSNASPRREALSAGSRHLPPFRNPRVVGGWLLRARLDQSSFTPLASSEHCFGEQRLCLRLREAPGPDAPSAWKRLDRS